MAGAREWNESAITSRQLILADIAVWTWPFSI
jgi:hypothetical protein